MINLRKIGEFFIVDLPEDTFLKGNIEDLKKAISELIDQGAIHILLNMTEITRIDGTGLGVLLNLQKISFYNNVNIRLYGLQPYVAQILFQTRLNRIFDICHTEDENIIEEALSDTVLIA